MMITERSKRWSDKLVIINLIREKRVTGKEGTCGTVGRVGGGGLGMGKSIQK